MVNETAISATISDLKTQAKPNFSSTAIIYEIDRRTLQRRFQGKTASTTMAHLETQGLLDAAQEKILVERINMLSARGLPPTPAMIQNLVQELIKGPVGEHWVNRFINRHNNELASVYLESIDYARRVADNSRHFSHYLMLVSVFF